MEPKVRRHSVQNGKQAKSETEVLNCYRRVRDEIKAFIETLPDTFGINSNQ
jgi:hypothetical protein